MRWHGASTAKHGTMNVYHAILTEFDYGDIPDDRFVMTTWHSKQSLSDTFWDCWAIAPFIPTVELEQDDNRPRIG